MKRKNGLLTLFMALVFAVTSVPIDYRLPEAAGRTMNMAGADGGDTEYSDVTASPGDAVEISTDGPTSADLISANDETAASDKVEASVGSAVFTIRIQNNSGAEVKYYVDDEYNNLRDWNDDIVFEYGKSYTLVITAGEENKILEISGAKEAATDYDGDSVWKQKITSEKISSSAKIEINERNPRAKSIAINTESITLNSENVINYIVTMEGKNTIVPKTEIRLYKDSECKDPVDSEDYRIKDNSVTLERNETTMEYEWVYIKITVGEGEDAVSQSKKLKVQYSSLILDEDYKIENAKVIYVKPDNPNQIYFSSAGNAEIMLFNRNYNKYRYKMGAISLSNNIALKDIQENEKVAVSNGSMLTFQMANQAADISDSSTIIESEPITLFWDNKAPVIDSNITMNGVSIDNSSGAYQLNGDDSLEIKVYDVCNKGDNGGSVSPDASENGFCSGIKEVYYVTDISDETTKHKLEIENDRVTLSADSLEEDENKTIFIYAVDNVGNTSEAFKIQYTLDKSAPSVEPNLNEYFLNDSTDGTSTYYYSFENSKSEMDFFELEITDAHLDLTNTTIKVNGNAQNISEDNLSYDKKTYIFRYEIINEDNKEYDIQIQLSDSFQNKGTVNYKIVVDNTPPDIIDAYAEPIKFKGCTDDGFALDNLPDNYIGYNESSELVIVFSDKNIDAKTGVSINIFGETIENAEINQWSNKESTYSVSYGFGDLLNENEYVDAQKNGTNVVTVTDKAGNKKEINISTVKESAASADTEVQTETLSDTTKQIVYIKNTICLKQIAPKSKNSFLELDDEGYICVKIDYSNATLINTDFLKVYLTESGNNDKKVIKLDFINVNNDKNKITFRFSAEDMELDENKTYGIEAYYFDVAADSEKFISRKCYSYDITAPTLSSKLDLEHKQIVYELTEKNPDFQNFKVTVNVKNNRESINNTIAEKIKNLTAEDIQDNKFTVEVPQEGDYEIKVIAVDKAGNESNPVCNKFTYDTVPPKVTGITANTGMTDNTDYKLFGSETEPLELIFEAENLVGSVNVICTLYDEDGNETIYSSDSKTAENKITVIRDGVNFTCTMPVSANFKGSFKYKIWDESAMSESKIVDIDKLEEHVVSYGIVTENQNMHEAASLISITEKNKTNAQNGFFNEDIILSMEAEDTYSGIREIKYGINSKEANQAVSLDQSNKIITHWSSSEDIVLPATAENEGNEIPVTLYMKDNAGHETRVSKSYKIDITKPVVSVTYDNNSVMNEIYYNRARTATIRITEVNFDLSEVRLHITKNGTAMSVEPNFVMEEENVYVMKLPFTEDGDYEVTVTAEDLAGNVSDYSRVDRFTIDNTMPEMTISFDNNEPFSENYYSESRTATITVREHNFDANGVDINVTAALDDAGMTAPSVSAFSSSGDTHVATITFDQNGDYTISASYRDLAGNEGTSLEAQSFTVDLSAPEIEITGVKAGSTYVGSVNPVVTVTDGNYDTEGVTITIAGSKHGEKEIESTIEDTAKGQTFSFSDLGHVQENDDCYTITAKAVDKAGHETEETISYKVNRFGSVYSVNEELQKALEQYYATSSDKYMIIEENVDKLKEYKITYTIDNEIVNLEEDMDYTVKQSANGDKWQQYEYSLGAETFGREGVYNISVSSVDVNGNLSDNKSKNLELEFCIDNTKPVCIISGVDAGEKYAKDASLNVVIEAYDNIKFSDMTVLLNGRQIKTEADMVDGKVSFKLEPSGEKQTLKVICHDAAGNEEVQELQFSFNVGLFGLPIWLIIAVFAALALLAGLILILILRRRKEQELN